MPARRVREKGFGALRLVLASLVLVSHSIELLNGSRAREPLHWLFGTDTLGGIAVAGFFVISGYLVPQSFEADRRGYLIRRVLRIYPGSIVELGLPACRSSFGGGDHQGLDEWGLHLRDMLLLQMPQAPGVFASLPYPALNGSMWTIEYEFACYLSVIMIGLLGIYRHPRWIVAMAIRLACASLPGTFLVLPHGSQRIASMVQNNAKFLAMFMAGTRIWLLETRFERKTAPVCLVALVPLMFLPWGLSTCAFVVLGGYLILWLAHRLRSTLLTALNFKMDLSYGVYLYAFPITNLLIWRYPGIDPAPLIAGTFFGALVTAFLSWTLVEQPALRLAHRMVAALNSTRTGSPPSLR